MTATVTGAIGTMTMTATAIGAIGTMAAIGATAIIAGIIIASFAGTTTIASGSAAKAIGQRARSDDERACDIAARPPVTARGMPESRQNSFLMQLTLPYG